MLLLEQVGRRKGLDGRAAVAHDGQVLALALDVGLAERDQVVLVGTSPRSP